MKLYLLVIECIINTSMKLCFFAVECINKHLLCHRKHIKYEINKTFLVSSCFSL